MTMHFTTDTVLKNLPGLWVVLKRSGIQQAKTPVCIRNLPHANPKAF